LKPEINKTRFGSITIDGEKIKHDVLIRLSGDVVKRKKKLSKELYGTSHLISLDEAQHIYEKNAQILIIGTGQFDNVRLSPEAQEFFDQVSCEVKLLATKEAIKAWNKRSGKVIGLFHITC
jgi:hypothetical protein